MLPNVVSCCRDFLKNKHSAPAGVRHALPRTELWSLSARRPGAPEGRSSHGPPRDSFFPTLCLQGPPQEHTLWSCCKEIVTNRDGVSPDGPPSPAPPVAPGLSALTPDAHPSGPILEGGTEQPSGCAGTPSVWDICVVREKPSRGTDLGKVKKLMPAACCAL